MHSARPRGRRHDSNSTLRAQILGTAASRKDKRPRVLIARKQLVDIPKDYHSYKAALPLLDDAAVLLCRSYKDALEAKFGYLSEQRLKSQGIEPLEDPDQWAQEELKIQASQLADRPASHELMFADKIVFMNQYMLRPTTENALNRFRKTYPKSKYLPALTHAFAQI